MDNLLTTYQQAANYVKSLRFLAKVINVLRGSVINDLDLSYMMVFINAKYLKSLRFLFILRLLGRMPIIRFILPFQVKKLAWILRLFGLWTLGAENPYIWIPICPIVRDSLPSCCGLCKKHTRPDCCGFTCKSRANNSY